MDNRAPNYVVVARHRARRVRLLSRQHARLRECTADRLDACQIGTLLVALVQLACGLFFVIGGVHGMITAPTHVGEGVPWIALGALPVIDAHLLVAGVLIRSHCLVDAGAIFSVREPRARPHWSVGIQPCSLSIMLFAMFAFAVLTSDVIGGVVGAALLVCCCLMPWLFAWLFDEVFSKTHMWINVVKARQPVDAAAVEADAAWSAQEESDPRIYAISTQAHFVSVQNHR